MKTVGNTLLTLILFAAIFASCKGFQEDEQQQQQHNIYTYYYVNYNANNGSGYMNRHTFTHGKAQTLLLNQFYRTGYNFTGWATEPDGHVKYTDGQSVNNLTATDNGTVMLYAVWVIRPDAYAVRYDANGGSGTMADSAIIVNSSDYLHINAFTRTGYIFNGWAASPDGAVVYIDRQSIRDLAAAGATATLYAVWTANTYTVIYNANGGSGTMSSQSFTYDEAQNLLANAFTRRGTSYPYTYMFIGWAATSSGQVEYIDGESVINLSTTNNGYVYLYAVWTTNTYTITYNANGGRGSIYSSDLLIDVPQNLPPNAFTRYGYDFSGWAAAPDGPAIYNDEQSVTNLAELRSIIVLYAVWVLRPDAYMVRYDANGGSGNMTDSIFIIDDSQNLQTNIFTRTYYTFQGWAASPDGPAEYTNWQNVSNLTTEAAITLYAVWRGFDYTVRYDANGGSGTMADSSLAYGKEQNLRPNAFTRNDYTFAGWAISSNGQAAYGDGESVINLTTVTGNTIWLYAVWLPEPGTGVISFDVEQIIDGLPIIEDITISRTGNGYHVTYLVSINASDYDAGSINWELVGVGIYAGQIIISYDSSITLNAGDIRYNTLGVHALTLTVTKNGQRYQRAIPFTIVR